jgi:hypothetical protein
VRRFVSPLDVWQDRLAPSEVLAACRTVHPRAELVHLAHDRWVLVTLDGDDALKQQGQRLLAETRRANAGFCARHPLVNPRDVDRLTVGLKVALLKAMGARIVDLYTTRDPSGAIALDFQRADFMARHETANGFWQAYDAPQDAERAAALRDLTDPARANDAWRHARTLTHTPGLRMAAAIEPDRSSTRRRITPTLTH